MGRVRFLVLTVCWLCTMPGTSEDQEAHPVFFDTLSDYDEETSMMESGSELCDWLFAPFSVQNYAAAVLSSTMHISDNRFWGSGREFDNCAVYVRSSPKQRMGKMLLPNETRVISILLVCNVTQLSKISIFRIFLADNVLPSLSDCDVNGELMPRNTHGPSVPISGITCWENHYTNMPTEQRRAVAASSEGHHLITCSSLTVRVAPTAPGMRKTQLIERVVGGHHDFPVARILSGVRVDDRLRHSIEETNTNTWVAAMTSLMRRFGADLSEVNRSGSAGDALIAARMACDEFSTAGIIDLMAADTSIGGLPDAFNCPFQMPLFLAVVTRLAAYPHRFDLWPGTVSDRFAASEVASCFESTETPVVEAVECDETEKHVLYAIDVVAQMANATISSDLERRKTNLKRKNAKDVLTDEQLYIESIESLMRMGIGLCFDVAGPISPNVYGKFGFASRELDAASLARQEKAARMGAIPAVAHFSGPRLTQRTMRQAKLFSILHDVEHWLLTGMWRGVQLNTPNVANPHYSWKKQPSSPSSSVQRCSRHRVFAPGEKSDWDTNLCQEAVRVAQSELVKLFSRGATAAAQTYGLTSCIYGPRTSILCAACPNLVTPHEGFGFGGTASTCPRCHRRLCLACQGVPELRVSANCLRCCAVDDDETNEA